MVLGIGSIGIRMNSCHGPMARIDRYVLSYMHVIDLVLNHRLKARVPSCSKIEILIVNHLVNRVLVPVNHNLICSVVDHLDGTR